MPAQTRSIAGQLPVTLLSRPFAVVLLVLGILIAGPLAGLAQVVIIHGHGTGALRDAVRSAAAAHPLVTSARAGERGEGGDGATIVSLG